MITPPAPRIGSLCTGYGGLDIAVMHTFGASIAWHCQYEPPDKHGREDRHQYAARILEHHWPHVPNHGDITAADWAAVEPVDIVTAGFPCQDLSYAGHGAGIKEGTRSGLWYAVARAIGALRPRLVVLENVRAIVNRRPGLDAVLASLAALRFDARWTCVRASDVGAPHERWRWFLTAWPADAGGPRLERAWARGAAPERGESAADSDDFGGDRGRPRSAGRDEPAPRRVPAPDPAGVGAGEPADETLAVAGGREARAVPGGRGGGAPAATQSVGRGEGRPEPAGIVGRPDAALGRAAAPAHTACERHRHPWPAGERGIPAAAVGGGAASAADAGRDGRERGTERDLGQEIRLEASCGDDAVGRVLDWGQYAPAIARWEAALGRPAPRPVDDRGRLDPAFVEWMMGLPAGWVTGVPAPPGMTAAGLRNARLKALGNGVVPQQAAHALRLLLGQAEREAAA